MSLILMFASCLLNELTTAPKIVARFGMPANLLPPELRVKMLKPGMPAGQAMGLLGEKRCVMILGPMVVLSSFEMKVIVKIIDGEVVEIKPFARDLGK